MNRETTLSTECPSSLRIFGAALRWVVHDDEDLARETNHVPSAVKSVGGGSKMAFAYRARRRWFLASPLVARFSKELADEGASVLLGICLEWCVMDFLQERNGCRCASEDRQTVRHHVGRRKAGGLRGSRHAGCRQRRSSYRPAVCAADHDERKRCSDSELTTVASHGCAPTSGPPNVPPLTSGRIRKRGGVR